MQVELAHYSSHAAQVVNADLSTDAGLHELVAARPWLEARVGPSDRADLERLQAQLVPVIDAAAAGDEQKVVELLNGLLEVYPIRPRISGHDASSWHLHVNEAGASVAGVLATESVMGLTTLVTEMGVNRIGRCAATGCNRAFVDTSTNRSKRFCSTRCATRTNVESYRARRRQQAASS